MDSIERASGHPGNAMQSLDGMDDDMESVELPSDPDAQATITDFLDFTEYLPSDMNRSLTLIGNLDYKYIKADSNLGELSKMYGELPSLDSRRRPEPSQLRADISHKLNQAVHTRTLAQAEARRMSANVDRHYQKLMYIQEKLEGLFDAFPTAQEELAASTLSVSPQATRTPKITLRLGEYGAHKGTRVKRGPRITVPGEVLAPNEFDWDTYDSECDISDTHDDEPTTPRPTQRRASSSGPKRIKLKVQRPKVDKTPKTPRAPRPAGVMGTNVHSQVAGISTSNALAKLKPPPEGAPVGSEHRPWGRLTPFELAKLRKRMKKNAVWQPSTTMINRELTLLERSISHFRAAKAEAEAAGQPFDRVWDSYGNAAAPSSGAPAEEAFEENEDLPIVNKGMKLNEQKKAKKETLAKLAVVEAEELARKMADAARGMRGLFGKAPANGAGKEAAMGTPETAAAKAPPKSAARKRKRESTAEADNLKALVPPATPAAEPTAATPPTPPPMPTAPAAKKAKTETPVPPPPSSVGSRIAIPPSANRARATTEASPAAEGTPGPPSTSATTITTTTTTTSVPLRQASPRKSSTPILPPTREKRSLKPDAKKTPAATVPTPSPAPAPAPTRARRSATKTPTPAPSPPRSATPALAPPLRRPPSRGHAASAEPGPSSLGLSLSLGRDRARRTSTARNTPVPEASSTPTTARPPSRRAKRPAPGPVTAGEEGSAAISVGRRTAAPRKKAAGRKGLREDSGAAAAVQEPDIEVDENGVAIDPAEPRYCLCNRVSYGEMIACENNQCQYEWFHLPCVGLTIETLPPRTTKWYCPDCRVALGIGEKGEVSARGRKK